MKRILFISTSVPPHFESQTIRNAFFIKALSDNGYQIEIITSPASKEDDSLRDIIANCKYNLTLIPPPWYPKFIQLVTNKLPNIYGKIIGYLANLLLVPDLFNGWSKKIMHSNLVHEKAKWSDIIISSSGSYEAHLAASKLSSKYQKCFVAELGDPWAKNPIWPESFLIKRIANSHLEKKSLSNADLITFTTKQTTNSYKKTYTNTVIETIPMGFSRAEFPLPSTSPKNIELNKVTYVGVAYKGSRDITPLIIAINDFEFSNLTLNVYGYTSQFFDRYVKENLIDSVHFHGPVSYERSVDILRKPSLLIILGNDGKLQIPGKVYMYLATTNPILYLGREEKVDDPTWAFLSEFEGVFYANASDRDDIQKTISEINSNWQIACQNSYIRAAGKNLAKYEWTEVSNRFASLVEKTFQAKRLSNEN